VAGGEPALAILLFDIVLGYGAHPRPPAALAVARRSARRAAASHGRALVAIGHVCGTDGDPQDRAAQRRTLVSAGVVVAQSNFEAASLAAELAVALATRRAANVR
jgi:hypothetical protein